MTDEELKELVASLAIAQKQTDLQLQELASAQKETDLQLKETAQQLKETDKQLSKQLKNLAEQIGGLAINLEVLPKVGISFDGESA